MNRKEAIASIKIVRTPRNSNIHLEMPIWIRRDANGRYYANLALLGGITTFADSEADLDIANNEAVTAFFNAIKKHGKGFREELIALGWQLKRGDSLRYKVRRDRPTEYGLPLSPAYQNMMQTGISKSLKVNVAA